MELYQLSEAVRLEVAFQRWLAPDNRKTPDVWPFLRDAFVRGQVAVAQHALGNKWFA